MKQFDNLLNTLKKPAKRAFKFGSVGVSGVIVNTSILYVFTEQFGLDYRISSLIAIELSIINNFIWNSLWTWSDKKATSNRNLSKRFVKFHLSSALTAFVINYGLLIILTELFHIPYQLSNLVGIAFGSLLNFFFSHFWVFRHKSTATPQDNVHSSRSEIKM
jgi:dolichol-phosphate mannosyltransferase